jgi:hypothetical protein
MRVVFLPFWRVVVGTGVLVWVSSFVVKKKKGQFWISRSFLCASFWCGFNPLKDGGGRLAAVKAVKGATAGGQLSPPSKFEARANHDYQPRDQISDLALFP